MELVLKAIKIADKAHKGQKRRGTGLPYVTHPIAVSYILAQYKQSKNMEDLIAAAILHDVFEDTELSFHYLAKEFNPLIASLVYELSNDVEEIKRVGKKEYQRNRLKGYSSYALIIKLADRYHNISDNPKREYVADTISNITFLINNRELSKSQRRLATDIINKAMEINKSAAPVPTGISQYGLGVEKLFDKAIKEYVIDKITPPQLNTEKNNVEK